MHGTILQIENRPIRKDEYITSYDISERQYAEYSIDYVGDDKWNERHEIVATSLPSEMFLVDGRKITINHAGICLVLDDMINTIKKCVNELNIYTIVKWEYMHKLRESIKCYDTKKDGTLFWYMGELFPLNEFILQVIETQDNKLYVGAALDYHF